MWKVSESDLILHLAHKLRRRSQAASVTSCHISESLLDEVCRRLSIMSTKAHTAVGSTLELCMLLPEGMVDATQRTKVAADSKAVYQVLSKLLL